MYNKDIFQPSDLTAAHDLIQAYNFGILITHTPTGLIASHLPWTLDPAKGQYGTLVSHMARANPHAEALQSSDEMLVIFSGPHGYISASWYAERDSAPTWNYTTVHCYGRVRVYDTDPANIQHLGTLVEQHEAERPDRWRMHELGRGGMQRRLPNIVVFELPITRLEAKFKLGQDERPQDTAQAITALEQHGQHDLATLMHQYNPPNEPQI